MNCWRCNTSLAARMKIFCGACKIIQPVSRGEDYFSYLGFSRQFPIDESDLKSRFRSLQSVVHPDKFAQASERERRMSEEHSSFLNSAYKTLGNPYSRANYLLDVLSNGSLEGKAAIGGLASTIMELNEEIEQLDDATALKEKLSEVQSKIDGLYSRLQGNFADNQLEEAKKTLDVLRYLNRSRKFIRKKLGMEEDS